MHTDLSLTYHPDKYRRIYGMARQTRSAKGFADSNSSFPAWEFFLPAHFKNALPSSQGLAQVLKVGCATVRRSHSSEYLQRTRQTGVRLAGETH